ncbi:CpaE-like family protein [Antrihabitans sp. YC3-6]|uniref:CpaE-like family protein n=1 Tax=Antrihabitans stalagmiti TaxID=2799499 RepID=A0A934NRU2_9NOCA|nr:septum site-determining protein Ssd [Antrihabitans stalagmiti]MBJ8340144.1 CpaE-like family protein [Antrihabitans stalagmiti]
MNTDRQETDRDDRTRTGALMVVRDVKLREDVRRVAAAADVALDEVAGVLTRRLWGRASTVVLDADAARVVSDDELPRRRGVVLVTDGEPELTDWQRAAAIGAEYVVGLPRQESLLVGVLGARPEVGSGDGFVVAVVGGRGGAGASTFAAALALSVESTKFRSHAMLVDGDSFGGGIDLLLGIENVAGLRWPSLSIEGGRVSAAALRNALPAASPYVSVLSCARGHTARDPSAAAVAAVLDAGRSAGNLVVADVARRTTPATDTFLEAADLVVLVVPAELRASAAAEATARMVSERNANLGVVVRGPAPGGLRGTDIADALGLPLLAAIRPEPRLADLVERGGLELGRRSPLRRAAESVFATLGDRPRTRWAA